MIISAVVGAGFATGAELIAFFGTSTLPPAMIAVLVGVLLFCVMTALVYLPLRMPRWIFAPVFFVFFVAMAAGVTELAGPVASAIAVVLSVMIVWFGFEHMIFANKILMAFALAVLAGVVIANLGAPVTKSGLPLNTGFTAGLALFYAGMNCCMLPAVFDELQKTHSRRKLLLSILAASVVIALFVFLILTAIYANGVKSAAMPVLALSDSALSNLAVFICILTSMFAALFNIFPSGSKTIKKLSGTAALGFAASFLGFTKVVRIFYPVVGVVMIVYIIFSFFRLVLQRFVFQGTRGHLSRSDLEAPLSSRARANSSQPACLQACDLPRGKHHKLPGCQTT